MASYMQQAGLVDCDDTCYNSGSVMYGPKAHDWLPRIQRVFITGMGQAMQGIFKKGNVDGMKTQEDYNEYIAKLRADMSGTRQPKALLNRAWGRKPS
jgi:hypothetical protein